MDVLYGKSGSWSAFCSTSFRGQSRHLASWLPGDDYYANFHEGDPFIKVPEGYARLPDAGYDALHPSPVAA